MCWVIEAIIILMAILSIWINWIEIIHHVDQEKVIIIFVVLYGPNRHVFQVLYLVLSYLNVHQYLDIVLWYCIGLHNVILLLEFVFENYEYRY